MHNPATESQMAKDFNALRKSVITTKPCDPHPLNCCPALPPHRERKSHSSYHAEDCHCPMSSHSHSCSCSLSPPCSPKCGHYDNDCCSHRSSYSCHDNYAGYHDFPPSPSEALFDCSIRLYCRADCCTWLLIDQTSQ